MCACVCVFFVCVCVCVLVCLCVCVKMSLNPSGMRNQNLQVLAQYLEQTLKGDSLQAGKCSVCVRVYVLIAYSNTHIHIA